MFFHFSAWYYYGQNHPISQGKLSFRRAESCHPTCHPERSRAAAQSKDLRTDRLLSSNIVRRSLDFARDDSVVGGLQATRQAGTGMAVRIGPTTQWRWIIDQPKSRHCPWGHPHKWQFTSPYSAYPEHRAWQNSWADPASRCPRWRCRSRRPLCPAGPGSSDRPRRCCN